MHYLHKLHIWLPVLTLTSILSSVPTAHAECGCTPQWQNDIGPMSGHVNAMVEWNGDLYIGGNFDCVGSTAPDCSGGIVAENIARWNRAEQRWMALDIGVRSAGFDWPGEQVNALTVFGGRLYVGGSFNRAGGLNGLIVANIARWNGIIWEKLHEGDSPGVSGPVNAMAVYLQPGTPQPKLYIGGEFYSAINNTTNVAVSGITSYSGLSFAPLQEGLEKIGGPRVVFALAVYGDTLVVGGSFDVAFRRPQTCSQLLPSIARWNGSAWSSVGGGISKDIWQNCEDQVYFRSGGVVNALAVYETDPLVGPELYAGGRFSYAGNELALNIARFNSIDGWRRVGGGVGTWGSEVRALRVFDDHSFHREVLYAGGNFVSVPPSQFGGGLPGARVNNIARWNGDCWSALPGIGSDGTTQVGVNSTVNALHSYRFDAPGFPADLIVGGQFTSVVGQPAFRIARLTVLDSDNDGVPDDCDNCPEDVNYRHGDPVDCNLDGDETDPGELAGEQCDADGDGAGDTCDRCRCGHDDFDSDDDDVPNACDNCPDTLNRANTSEVDCNGNGVFGETKYGEGMDQQCDSNANGIGDPCDQTRPTDFRLARIKDLAGNTLETFEYDPANGRLTTRYRGTAAQHILQTTYGYNTGGRLSTITHAPSDGTGQLRTVELKYDPQNPDQVVGTVHGDCGCGNGNRFVYRDSRGRVMRITTANDQPQLAPVLEEFEYMEASGGPGNCGADLGDINDDGIIDDRLKIHRRRNEAGVFVEVERRVYVGGPVGPYTVIVCRPSSGQFEVRKEHYDGAGLLEQLDEQDDLQISCVDPGAWTAITTYSYFPNVNAAGAVIGETWTTEYPSGYKDVTSWGFLGSPNAPDSTRVHVSSRTSSSGVEVNKRTETYEYDSILGDYRLKTVLDPNGAITTFSFDDPGFPDHVISETRSGPDGLSFPATTSIKTTFVYDPGGSGRIWKEVRSGPNWTGPSGCSANAEAGCVVSENTYDGLGRLVKRIEDSGTGKLNRVNEYRYNAFDEQIASREPGNLVRARHYNGEGQIDYDYSFEFDGDLNAIGDASQPPTGVTGVFEQRHYEYHPVSGKTTRERVVLSDTVPFAFSPAPPITVDTVSTYDVESGQWLRFVTRPGLGPSAFEYDAQGRVHFSISPEGVVTKTDYNGRGLVKETGLQDALSSPTISLLTETHYRADGQVDWRREPNGAYFVHEYDDFGRLWKKMRCDTSACDGEFHYVTTFEYDSAGNVKREYTWDGLTPSSAVADTATDYDFYGRPYRVRRRATFNATSPVNDDDDSDGKADEVTLTKYNAAGGVEVVAGKLSGAPTTYLLLTDQVTIHAYDNLGRLARTTQVNKDSAGVPVYEYSTRVYEGTADRVKWECMDAFSCTTSVPILTQRQYDATGQVTKTIDPEGHYVEQFYDSRGHAIRRISYEELSTGQRDGLGGTPLNQDRWKYDDAGRLIQTARMADASTPPPTAPNPAVDQVTGYSYDDDDHRLKTTVYNMNSISPLDTQSVYDRLGRRELVIDAMNNSERTHFEGTTGLVLDREVYDGLGVVVTAFGYDGLGRPRLRIQGAGTEALETIFGYDAADRVVLTRNRRAVDDYLQTRVKYDLLGRRAKLTEADGTNQARTTTFAYDRLGRMTSQTAVDTDPDPDQQQVTLYGYDLVGRRVQSVFPDSINQTSDLVIVRYDAAGRVVYRNAFGMQEAILEYDRRSLLKTRSLNPGAATTFYESFNYDGAGRMTEASRVGNDPSGSYSSVVDFGYDGFSNLKSEKQDVLGAGIKFFYYQYDQAGNRLCADCPSLPGTPLVSKLDYAYNGISRMTAITRNGIQLASYDYASGGGSRLDKRRVFTGVGNNVIEYDPAYDEHGRTKGISNNKVASGLMTVLDVFSTPFDGLGNPYYTVRFRDPGIVERGDYTYDSLSRLKLVDYCCDSPPKVENFNLDGLGNRNSYSDTRPDPDFTIAYDANNAANEYTTISHSTISGVAVSYDAGGNLIRNEAGYTFDYDPDNRLMQVKDPTGTVMASYAYDALGRRVREVKDGKTAYFYYDGQRVFAEYEKTTPTATAALARYYVDGPMYVDEHVLMHEGGNGPGEGKDFYYLLGPLYTVAGLADSEGKIVQAYSYDAYGDVVTMPAPPTVTAGGSRYLLVTPADQGEIPVALVVMGGSSGPDAACFYGYVQSKCSGGPNNGLDCLTDADCPKRCVGGQFPGAVCAIATDCPQGACVGSCDEGTLGDTPFYKLSGQWGTAKVRGREIRPGTTYSVYAERNLGGGAAFSSAATAATWTWSDVDHNGMVNVIDVANLVNALKGSWGPFTFEQMNLYGCEPDAVFNALDIVLAVDAVRGFGFPCDPATCGTSNFPPPNPYHFTGRRLNFDLRAGDPGASLSALPPGTIAGSPVLTLYDYRAREYDARHGRFLQRDPAGYVDGMNLYEAFTSNPLRFLDPEGTKNWEAYNRDRETHDQWYADFMDMLGVYDVTPERNALAEDAIGLVKELAGRRQLIKELGGQIASGVEILGAFNDGADLAIVLNEWSEGRVNVAQFAILLPLIGNGHIKLLSKCGKELKVFRGTGPDKLSTIVPVRDLRRFLRGTSKGDKEIHHLIELRFHPALGISNADDVEGALISALEHRGVGAKQLSDAVEGEIEKSLTQMFREAIPYRPRNDPEYYRRIPVQVIYEAHRDVYARFGVPDLIEKIKPWFAAVGAKVD